MKKILTKLRSLIIGVGTSASVIACGNETEKSQNNLNTIINNKNLGNIIITNSIPTKEELILAIKEKNSNAIDLTLEDFEFKKGFKRGIKKSIIVGKGKYIGEVILEYSNVIFNMENFLNRLILLNYQKIYGEKEITFATISNTKIDLKFEEITSNNQISTVILSENLIDSEKSEFKNSTNIQQQNITQTFTKTVTNTVSISNRTDIGIKEKIKGSIPGFFDEESEIDFSYSKTTTNTKSEIKTITSSAQRINVPPHKEIDVIINLYKTKAISKYILILKLNKNSTFSGDIKFGNKIYQTEFLNKEFNFYNLLIDIGIDNSKNENLVYAKNDNLYSETILLITSELHDFKVTEKEKPYI